MAEYIEREKVYDIFSAKQQVLLKYHRYYQLNDADKEEFDLYDSYMNEVESIPSADVVEVVHGEWVRGMGSYTRIKCSRCEWTKPYIEDFYEAELLADMSYCPHCGAKMDGERRSDNG